MAELIGSSLFDKHANALETAALLGLNAGEINHAQIEALVWAESLIT